jgi:hypothetical protein
MKQISNRARSSGGTVVALHGPRADVRAAMPMPVGFANADATASLGVPSPDAGWRMRMHGSTGGLPPDAGQEALASKMAVHAELVAAAAIAAQLPERMAARARGEAVRLADSMRARLPNSLADDVIAEIGLVAGRSLGADRSSLLEIRAGIELLPLARFGLDDDLLLGSGEPARADWDEIASHLIEAARLIARVPGLAGTAAVVLAARERVDGSGYPYALGRDEVPRESGIVGACEAYAALRSPRPWRDACEREDAVEVLDDDPRFDPEVIAAVASAAAQLD